MKMALKKELEGVFKSPNPIITKVLLTAENAVLLGRFFGGYEVLTGKRYGWTENGVYLLKEDGSLKVLKLFRYFGQAESYFEKLATKNGRKVVTSNAQLKKALNNSCKYKVA
ncbi:MAG: hypothetical protein IJP68_10175 [Selenomonadaceae bacterium]|nr:hypothetical protein [Selenomonadaceae bacterium]